MSQPKIATLMEELRRKKYQPPSKSEGWFSKADAIADCNGGMGENTIREVLQDAVKNKDLECKNFKVWDDTQNRPVTRAYYRKLEKKLSSGG